MAGKGEKFHLLSIDRQLKTVITRNERGPSPSESQVSAPTPLPHPHSQYTSGRAGGTSNNRAGGGASSASNKRRTGGNTTIRGTPLANEAYSASHDTHVNGSSRRGGAGAASTSASAGGDAYNNHLPPSSSHPSLPHPYQNGNGGGAGSHLGNGYDVHGISHIAGAQDWNSIPRAQQLEGPGMPVARSASIHSTTASVAVINSANGHNNNVDTTDAGDADGDGDDRTYCFCDGVSYGEMIACDDENCEREWVCFSFSNVAIRI